MLSLAPALVNPPAVFVADEPTLGLAPLAAEEIMDAIRRLRDLGLDDPPGGGEGARGARGGGHGRVHGARPSGVDGTVRPARRGTPRGHLPGDGVMSDTCRALGDRQHRAARAPRRPAAPRPRAGRALRAHTRQGRAATPASSSGSRRDRGRSPPTTSTSCWRSTPTASATWATASVRAQPARWRR